MMNDDECTYAKGAEREVSSEPSTTTNASRRAERSVGGIGFAEGQGIMSMNRHTSIEPKALQPWVLMNFNQSTYQVNQINASQPNRPIKSMNQSNQSTNQIKQSINQSNQ
jgi:hypothetical protein